MSVCTLSLAGEPILIIASANTKTFVSHVTFSVHHLFLTLLSSKFVFWGWMKNRCRLKLLIQREVSGPSYSLGWLFGNGHGQSNSSICCPVVVLQQKPIDHQAQGFLTAWIMNTQHFIATYLILVDTFYSGPKIWMIVLKAVWLPVQWDIFWKMATTFKQKGIWEINEYVFLISPKILLNNFRI